MSKQSEAKARQGYVPKFTPNVCGNCINFHSIVVEHPSYMGGTWKDEKKVKCKIGQFAVKKQGTCNEWATLFISRSAAEMDKTND